MIAFINLIYATMLGCPKLPRPMKAEGITCMGILENLIAEFIFLAILIIFGLLIYYFTKRRKLLKFFGINKWKKLIIYVANLRVQPGGANDYHNIPRSYQGTAIPYGEMLASNHIKHGFSFLIPALSDSPGILSKLGVSDIKIEITPSPVFGIPIEHSCSVISLGSPAYNLVSSLIETNYNSRLRFDPNGLFITVAGQSPITVGDIGIIERVVDNPEKRNFFYVAGLSEFATSRAGFFLIDQWKRLFDLYGSDKSFIVVVRFDLNSLSSWQIIHQEGY